MTVFFQHPVFKKKLFQSSVAAFSLVEVVLALGVASFSILIVVSLLPVGLQSSRDSLEETSAVNVMSAVVMDRQATPAASASIVYGVPVLTVAKTGVFGVTSGDQLAGSLAQAQYRVDYKIIPPTAGRLDPYRVWFKVSWPAASANPTGSVEGVSTCPQP